MLIASKLERQCAWDNVENRRCFIQTQIWWQCTNIQNGGPVDHKRDDVPSCILLNSSFLKEPISFVTSSIDTFQPNHIPNTRCSSRARMSMWACLMCALFVTSKSCWSGCGVTTTADCCMKYYRQICLVQWLSAHYKHIICWVRIIKPHNYFTLCPEIRQDDCILQLLSYFGPLAFSLGKELLLHILGRHGGEGNEQGMLE